ncbi:MAG: hypothetical protein WEB87_04755 [Bacteriovoracaceae bacterium]
MANIKDIHNLRIVTVSPPYDTWKNLLARELFNQAIDVRLRGFAKEYPYGVMPIDTSDFIAHHNLVCLDHGSEQSLEVLSAFKTVALKKCQTHNVPFPALSLVKLAGTPDHVRAVEDIMENALENKKELVYMASYTMKPQVRNNPVLLRKLREIFNAMYSLTNLANGFDEILVGGTMRFKMHERFARIGHSPLSLDGEELPPIHVEHLAKEQVQVMHLNAFSKEARAMAEPWLELWNQRINIQAANENENLKLAG